MFENHNKLTKTTVALLAVSSMIGIYFTISLLPYFQESNPILVKVMAATLIIMLILNTCITYLVYQRSFKALKLCLWLYGLQIFGFESESFTFILNFGLHVSFYFDIGSSTLIFNLATFVIWVTVLLAMRSVNKVNKSNQTDVEQHTTV